MFALVLLLAVAGVGWGNRIPSVVPNDTIGFRHDTKFLLVVGSVTRTGARILWEADHSRTGEGSVRVDILEEAEAQTAQEDAFEAVHSVSFTVADRPQVISLHGLIPGRGYRVKFRLEDGTKELADDVVAFRTLCGPADSCEAGKHSVLFVSCDRVVEEDDAGWWHALRRWLPPHSARATSPWTAAFHLGDQVYQDQVVAEILAHTEIQTHDAMVERFRRLYRWAWTHPKHRAILRHGAHYMLPDDHDVVNNLHHWMTRRDNSVDPENRIIGLAIKHNHTGTHAMKDIIYAGLQAYYEYQHQLRQSLPEDWGVGGSANVYVPQRPPSSESDDTVASLDDQPGPVPPLGIAVAHHSTARPHAPSDPLPWTEWVAERPIHFHAQFGALAVVTLDTRMQRTFDEDSAATLVSRAQMMDFWAALRVMERTDAVKDVVVASSIPLLWMGEQLARVAKWYENDKYSTYPSEVTNGMAIWELMGVSSKVKFAVGGDVHVLSRGIVCDDATNWESDNERLRQAWKLIAEVMDLAKAGPVGTKMRQLLEAQPKELPRNALRSLLRYSMEADQWDEAGAERAASSIPPSLEQAKCITTIVASSTSVGSAVAANHIFMGFFLFVRYTEEPRLGPWKMQHEDMYLHNNGFTVQWAEDRDGRQLRAVGPPEDADVPQPARRRWQSDTIHQVHRCGSGEDTALRQGLAERAEVDMGPERDALRPLCECGSRRDGIVSWLACRRVMVPEEAVVQWLFDNGRFVLIIAGVALLLLLGSLARLTFLVIRTCYRCCASQTKQLKTD